MDHLERYLCLSKHPKCHEDGRKFGWPRKKTPRPCNNVLGELLEVIDAGIVELAEDGEVEVHIPNEELRTVHALLMTLDLNLHLHLLYS